MTDDALLDALARSAHEVAGVLTRVAAAHELSLTQLRVLAILRDRDALRMSELAAFLGLDRSTLSGLVDRAEKRGLLRRSALPDDGRVVLVALTDDGRDFAIRLVAGIHAELAPRAARLSPAERDRLTALLERTFAD
jgi:DNA-binding MarR family transcriptional regulator